MSKLFGTKEEAKLSLRIFSYIIIGVALISIVATIVSFASGEMYEQAFLALESVDGLTMDTAGVAQGITIGILALSIILGLLEFYVGYKGIREANGVKQGGGYLVLVSIYMAIVAIALIMILVNAIRTPGGFNDWFSFVSPAADLLFAFFFLGNAKTLRNDNKR